MILYLTSDMGGVCELGGRPGAVSLKKENGFLRNVRKDLKKMRKKSGRDTCRCLVFPADPTLTASNAEYVSALKGGFELSRINVSDIDICNMDFLSENGNKLPDLNSYGILYFMGGSAPVQNRFFKEVDLKEKIADFDGLVLALSAGSINCAETAYCIPETDEEAAGDPALRFVPGLGLADRQIIPHFDYLQTIELNGRRLIEDIVMEDSFGHEFIALCDGSYIRLTEGDLMGKIKGRAYRVADGTIRRL